MTQPDVVLDSPERTVGTAGDYLELMKPRIIMLVVFTFIAGLVAAQSVTGLVINPVLAIVATIAVSLGSGAAGAINMWFDADIDARMARTATRPIPSGAVPREEALSLGIIISAMSVLLMWMASNVLAAVILAISIVYYGVFYTMLLKRRTPQNIVIGGAAGAFPPLIGWVAVTGAMSVDAWILFAIIFFWTPPHFWALSLVAHKEYERVGVPMLPVTHGARATRKQMLAYTLILTPIALAPLLTGLGGIVYAFVSVPVSLGFIYFAVRIYRSRAGDADAGDKERKLAMSMFAFSILYLFLLFAAVLAEHGFNLYMPVGG
ncbi:MAG: Protoheme IX farnesyltransferase [Hyphomonas sp. TMED17]|nr:MAG: protoheme IX farnesyltransferase [Hyphomonas sp. TMED17]CAI8416111.1 MAG: Protoheme IX farnesyltransferase [Hyphomonas sp. TMED17]